MRSRERVNLEKKMHVSQAVEILHRYGYRANASTTLPGYVDVLDPVLVLGTGGAPARTEFKRVRIPAAHVYTFLVARD